MRCASAGRLGALGRHASRTKLARARDKFCPLRERETAAPSQVANSVVVEAAGRANDGAQECASACARPATGQAHTAAVRLGKGQRSPACRGARARGCLLLPLAMSCATPAIDSIADRDCLARLSLQDYFIVARSLRRVGGCPSSERQRDRKAQQTQDGISAQRTRTLKELCCCAPTVA